MKKDSEGKMFLAPCGVKPNCVSSQNTTGMNKIEPFIIDTSAIEAMNKIKTIITKMPGSTIIEEESLYLYVEFKSKIFGFVDDVEFFADEKAGKIHVRSASRVGLSDFGVNRRRIEKIRSYYNK